MSINSATVGAKAGLIENSSVLVLAGRALLSAIFILAGFGKLTAIGATAGWFGSLGFPLPTVVVVLVGLLELLGWHRHPHRLPDTYRRDRARNLHACGHRSCASRFRRSGAVSVLPEEPRHRGRPVCSRGFRRRRSVGRRQARLIRAISHNKSPERSGLFC